MVAALNFEESEMSFVNKYGEINNMVLFGIQNELLLGKGFFGWLQNRLMSNMKK